MIPGILSHSNLILLIFKHNNNSNQHPFSIVMHRQSPFCPAQLLLDYFVRFGSLPGPLFANPDNSPVSRTFFADILCFPCKSCGLSPMRYKSHSFRIGAASFAAGRGMSDAQVKALRKRKTNDFLRIQNCLLLLPHNCVHTWFMENHCIEVWKLLSLTCKGGRHLFCYLVSVCWGADL